MEEAIVYTDKNNQIVGYKKETISDDGHVSVELTVTAGKTTGKKKDIDPVAVENDIIGQNVAVIDQTV